MATQTKTRAAPHTSSKKSGPPILQIGLVIIVLFALIGQFVIRPLFAEEKQEEGGSVFVQNRVAYLHAWHAEWHGQVAQMSDEEWNNWLRRILRGLDDDTNLRAVNSRDLWEHSQSMLEFLNSLGIPIDDFILSRDLMDISNPDDEASVLEWQDALVGVIFEYLNDEGLGADTPRYITDLLDWLIGNQTNEDGIPIDNKNIQRSLEEMYQKIREVVEKFRIDLNEGDPWALNHTRTFAFLEHLLELLEHLLRSGGNH